MLTRQRQTSLDDHTMAVATYWAAKRHGVSEQTIYTWRKRFGGFQASEVRRLKQLEAENARLKKLVAERGLEIEVMKETMRRRSGVITGHPIVILAVERLSGPATAPPPREPFCWPPG